MLLPSKTHIRLIQVRPSLYHTPFLFSTLARWIFWGGAGHHLLGPPSLQAIRPVPPPRSVVVKGEEEKPCTWRKPGDLGHQVPVVGRCLGCFWWSHKTIFFSWALQLHFCKAASRPDGTWHHFYISDLRFQIVFPPSELIPPACIYLRQCCGSRAPGPPHVPWHLRMHSETLSSQCWVTFSLRFAGVFCIGQKPSARTHSRVSAQISTIMKYRPDLCSFRNSINFQTIQLFLLSELNLLLKKYFYGPGEELADAWKQYMRK